MSVPDKRVQNGTVECDDYMRVPVIKTRWETLRDGLYNPTEGTVLGKTGKGWGNYYDDSFIDENYHSVIRKIIDG